METYTVNSDDTSADDRLLLGLRTTPQWAKRSEPVAVRQSVGVAKASLAPAQC
jgi:hypothetical protein